MASKVWAESSEKQKSFIYNPIIGTILGSVAQKKIVRFFPVSDFTWQAALKYWLKSDEEMAMLSLGHVLHLIQDAAAPAHTRNDPHPDLEIGGRFFGDTEVYEGWTRQFTLENGNVDLEKHPWPNSPILAIPQKRSHV